MSYHGPVAPMPSQYGYQKSRHSTPPGGPGKRRWSRRKRLTLGVLSAVAVLVLLVLAVV